MPHRLLDLLQKSRVNVRHAHALLEAWTWVAVCIRKIDLQLKIELHVNAIAAALRVVVRQESMRAGREEASPTTKEREDRGEDLRD